MDACGACNKTIGYIVSRINERARRPSDGPHRAYVLNPHARLIWYATLYGIGEGLIRNTAVRGDRQVFA